MLTWELISCIILFNSLYIHTFYINPTSGNRMLPTNRIRASSSSWLETCPFISTVLSFDLFLICLVCFKTAVVGKLTKTVNHIYNSMLIT